MNSSETGMHAQNSPNKSKTPCIFHARRRLFLKGNYLAKAAQRFTFVVEYIKNREQLCDRKQVLDLLRQFEKLERSAFFIDGGKARYKLADTARVDIPDPGKVQKDLALAFA